MRGEFCVELDSTQLVPSTKRDFVSNERGRKREIEDGRTKNEEKSEEEMKKR